MLKKMNETKIQMPLTVGKVRSLKAGQKVLLSGALYTARDQAHKKICHALAHNKRVPIDLSSALIYYCGPTPARPGRAIGSCGPTTSARMDEFTPALLAKGLKGMIGKGERSQEVVKAIQKNKAVYFIAVGGAGALLSCCVKKASIVAYSELGTEAVRKLEVEDFPVIVAIDSRGKTILKRG
ncbi:MAG: Fe-S-containing hydro-lyase [Candidatus Ancaeobacter aquaticus]|nr:Fe-S-containing hydro-lyase [Candidatus Ancaeobacter aquaticus]